MPSQDGHTCAICFTDELNDSEMAVLPCCHRDTATHRFCSRCIDTVIYLARPVPGRCPNCSGYLKKNQCGELVVSDNQGKCQVCQQTRQLSEPHLCAACAVGLRMNLRYVCERCEEVQAIPHPMYRYQPTATDYTSVTWACHRGCASRGAYTRWKITPEDAERIPLQELPEGWGGREQWLEAVRRTARTRQTKRRGARIGPSVVVAAVVAAAIRWITRSD